MLRRAKTLRIRFAIWVAGLLMVALLGFSIFVYISMARSLTSAVDASLQLSAAQAIAAVNIEDGQISLTDMLPETADLASLRGSGLTLRIVNPDGQVMQSVGPYRDLPVNQASIAAAIEHQASFMTVTDAAYRAPIRVRTAPIIENDRVLGAVQVAQSLDSVSATLRRLLVALLLSIPLLIVIAAVGGYALAARALAPISAIIAGARRISAEDLHARLNLPPTDDEVGLLAATFDEMLGRLDESFQRERQFTADASHELRTPLAAMQVILSVTRAEQRTPEAYEQALDDLMAETNRLRAMVEDLLRLARSEAPTHPVRDRVNLTALLHDVTDSIRPLAAAHGLALVCNVPDRLAVCGDGDDLIRLFVNLLDNAVKYTEQGEIVVRAAVERTMACISISDTGVGIAAGHLPRLFDRFYRVDPARTTGGAGLGLAIVQDIVRTHGGLVEVQSTLGAGTVVTIRLPLEVV